MDSFFAKSFPVQFGFLKLLQWYCTPYTFGLTAVFLQSLPERFCLKILKYNV